MVCCAHKRERVYTIIQNPALVHPPGLAWVKGSNKVILSEQPGEWHLEYEPIDIANGNVYKSVLLSNSSFVLETIFTRIHPPPGFLSIIEVLGNEPDSSEVRQHIESMEQWCLNDFFQAVIQRLSSLTPAWQFLIPDI